MKLQSKAKPVRCIEQIFKIARGDLFLCWDQGNRFGNERFIFSEIIMLFSIENGDDNHWDVAEHIVAWQPTQASGVSPRKCHYQFTRWPRANDLADRLHRMVTKQLSAHQDCSRDGKHLAESLSWEACGCIPLQSSKNFWIILEGMSLSSLFRQIWRKNCDLICKMLMVLHFFTCR